MQWALRRFPALSFESSLRCRDRFDTQGRCREILGVDPEFPEDIKALITTLAVKAAYRRAEDRQPTAAAAEFRHSYYDPQHGIRQN
ncbi:hypothetical protein NDU88_004400 [Pleurodeles waltl]|uniref:Uncharacterized protein n=1 Tax=Pleurodeles waltl TaxID=8319 RepID=A0AAV7SIR7_PLEWA|nr:hypothetical protein NDU88_004400 [Pleurodeles waltl]